MYWLLPPWGETMLRNPFTELGGLESAISGVASLFEFDPASKRVNTETQLIKLVADILNSKSTDWPEHDPTIPAAHRFINILEKSRTVSGLYYDSIGYSAVASPRFSGLRMLGFPDPTGSTDPYHILNLSYAMLEKWYRQ